jgi:alkylated DNA repair dioxygenase AlkB
MQTLFPVEPVLPGGFQYFPEFLTPTEEEKLINTVKNIDLHIFNFQGFEAKRKVASFGYDYSFDKRKLSKGQAIPLAFHWLIEKVCKKISIGPEKIGELLVTEYPAGSVINWHRDAPPFDLIAGISLLSDCKFKLRLQEKSKQTRNAVITIPVNRRSLYIMEGAARSEWQHSIAAVAKPRYSITLRTLRETGK